MTPQLSTVQKDALEIQHRVDGGMETSVRFMPTALIVQKLSNSDWPTQKRFLGNINFNY